MLHEAKNYKEDFPKEGGRAEKKAGKRRVIEGKCASPDQTTAGELFPTRANYVPARLTYTHTLHTDTQIYIYIFVYILWH